MGESHARYNWDAIVGELAAGTNALSKMDKKHSSAEFQDFAYFETLFAHAMGSAIDAICDNIEMTRSDQNHTLVLQWGAWDLRYWSIEYILGDARSAKQILNLIGFASTRQCASKLRFVLVTNVPHPHCEKNKVISAAEPIWRGSEYCIQHRGGRNNYKISAINEFFERQFLEMNLPHVQVVDAYSILSSRIEYKEYVCKSHFVCREDNGDILTTPAGAVVAEAVKRAICVAADMR